MDDKQPRPTPRFDTDALVRGVAMDGRVRVIAVRCDGVSRTLAENQDAGPTAAVALSRAATAALLLGATIKDRQQIGVQLNGNGPLGEIYAVADAHGRVRATVADPHADVPLRDGGVDLPAGIGAGRMTIIKRLAEDEPAFQGVTALTASNVAEDLSEYLAQSEQIESAVALGELIGPEGVTAAGGLLVQMLPGAGLPETLAMQVRLESLPPLSTFFGDGGTAADLARLLGDDVQIMDEGPVAFVCNCERERYARILVAMGPDELTSLRDEQEITECVCHFCGTRYAFDQEQMGALIYGAKLHMARLESMSN
ncbi:MAG: Hsp33 family molecular chaperone HslO [Myxococcales bacterium]|nr:Hsp33 family molecular chaperone HslO [Myxococcales bacterium]MCB9545228.1 Hsp33 family molecular chaperone HslO [Myxococcales bacterium]